MARKVTRKEDGAAAAESAAAPQVYVVVSPITYGDPEVRREEREEASDIPAESLPWLLAQGHIRVKEGN